MPPSLFYLFPNAWMQGNKIDITCILLNKNRNNHVWFILSWHVEVNVTLNIVHLLFIYLFIFLQTIGAAFCRKDLYIQGRNLSLAIWVGFFIAVVVWFCTLSQANLNTIYYPLFCYIVILGHSWGRKISSHECNVLSQCKGCNHLLWFVKPSGSLSYTNFYCNTYTK